MKPQLLITLLFWMACFNVASADVGAIYDAHIAWKTAFEGVDIAAVETIWSHAADTTLITLDGKQKNGWKEIQATLFLSFQLTGETNISESNLLITLSGNTASATSDYRWSPLPNVPLSATELYRKENGVWKMIAQDGTGGLEPLRRDDETHLREQVQQTHDALVGADLDALLGLIADDFTYIALNGTVHRQFEKAVIGKDVEQIRDLHLVVIYLTDDAATAHYTLTHVNSDKREIQLVYNVNFQLTQINFAPKSLAVKPNDKHPTLWARIKAPSPD